MFLHLLAYSDISTDWCVGTGHLQQQVGIHSKVDGNQDKHNGSQAKFLAATTTAKHATTHPGMAAPTIFYVFAFV